MTPVTFAWLPLSVEQRRVPVVLKMENLQVGGTFRARGVFNLVEQLPTERRSNGLVTVWQGWQAFAVLRAGRAFRTPTTLYVPKGAGQQDALVRFRGEGGRVVVTGHSWEDALSAAQRRAARDGACFIHPWGDEMVMNGFATAALELLDEVPDIGVVVIPAGPSTGHGLLGAFAAIARELRPSRRIVGASSNSASRRLDGAIIPGKAARGPADVEQLAADRMGRHVNEIVDVSELEAQAAQQTIWRELGAGASEEGASSLAAVLSGKVPGVPGTRTAVIVTEAGFRGVF